jgi:hypothetical protein
MYEFTDSRNDGTSKDGAMSLARCLGWFSIGLGAMEVLAPGRLARSLGMYGREGLIQAYGAREIMTGLAILSTGDPTPWIWGRVAGDALDIATLSTAMDERNPRRRNVEIAIAMVAAVTAADVVCGQQLAAGPGGSVQRYETDRSGFPLGVASARGADTDYRIPREYRSSMDTPPPM